MQKLFNFAHYTHYTYINNLVVLSKNVRKYNETNSQNEWIFESQAK